mgnify:CR=1 FL=1
MALQSDTPEIALVVAADEAGGIGYRGALPWNLPGDLAFFKRVTMGCPLVMGRRTHESIGRALPGRANIVVTAQPDYRAFAGARTAGSLDAALAVAREQAPGATVMVIGGSGVFAQALPRARRLYLTRVHASYPADTHLPAIAWEDWTETWCEAHDADARNPVPYSFHVLERRGA